MLESGNTHALLLKHYYGTSLRREVEIKFTLSSRLAIVSLLQCQGVDPGPQRRLEMKNTTL